jgi:uncharacterized protein with GYD domain
MATFITYAKWTQKGAENIRESPARLDKFRAMLQSFGGSLKDFYMVTGRYDMVIVTEADSAEVIARALLTTASGGSVSTETVQAFTETEYRKIVGSLP